MSKLHTAAGASAADPPGTENKAGGAGTVVTTHPDPPDVATVDDERRNALEAAQPDSALEALGRHPAGGIDFEPPRIEDRPQGADV